MDEKMVNICVMMAKLNSIFWDFDGVIKDSVAVKSDAYEQLFKSFGSDVAKKVRSHHESNGGMSRYDKLPLYLKWSNQSISQTLIDKYTDKFSALVKQEVIESEWVVGVLDYIKNNSQNQSFFIVTATPQSEIEEILNELQIRQYFLSVIGSPTEKSDAIRTLLTEYNVERDKTVMIGDSSSDYKAAIANHVPFVLRCTDLNKDLQNTLDCPMIKDFSSE